MNFRVAIITILRFPSAERICEMNTVNVVIFAGGKFRENDGKTFYVGVIFTILLLFPS